MSTEAVKIQAATGTRYRWYVLGLAALTHVLYAMQYICMPVLFREIADVLGLNLVQIGSAWGIVSLAGMFTVFLGGILGDRFGYRRTLCVLCLLTGLAGALRGLSNDFISLATTMFIVGFLGASIPVIVHKTVATWFSGRNLGAANGVVSTAMGVGHTVGALISAAFLSPLIGGWRNVLFFYGALIVILGLVWFFTVKDDKPGASKTAEKTIPFRQSISQVLRIGSVWLVGLALLGFFGGQNGVVGYVPMYLRSLGWSAGSADGTLAAFNAASTAATIPLAFLSDRLSSRKLIIFPAFIISTIGIVLLAFVQGNAIWVLMVMVGLCRDGLMAVTISLLMEFKQVGSIYAGTAVGLVFTVERLGGFIAPPVGNSLASISQGLPFLFWAAFILAGLIILFFVKAKKK